MTSELQQALDNVISSVQCLSREDAEQVCSIARDIQSAESVAGAVMRVVMVSSGAQCKGFLKQQALLNLQVAFGSSTTEARQRLLDNVFVVVDGHARVEKADDVADCSDYFVRVVDVYSELPPSMQVAVCATGASHAALKKCMQDATNRSFVIALWKTTEPERLVLEWEGLKKTFSSLPKETQRAVLAAARGATASDSDSVVNGTEAAASVESLPPKKKLRSASPDASAGGTTPDKVATDTEHATVANPAIPGAAYQYSTVAKATGAPKRRSARTKAKTTPRSTKSTRKPKVIAAEEKR